MAGRCGVEGNQGMANRPWTCTIHTRNHGKYITQYGIRPAPPWSCDLPQPWVLPKRFWPTITRRTSQKISRVNRCFAPSGNSKWTCRMTTCVLGRCESEITYEQNLSPATLLNNITFVHFHLSVDSASPSTRGSLEEAGDRLIGKLWGGDSCAAMEAMSKQDVLYRSWRDANAMSRHVELEPWIRAYVVDWISSVWRVTSYFLFAMTSLTISLPRLALRLIMHVELSTWPSTTSTDFFVARPMSLATGCNLRHPVQSWSLERWMSLGRQRLPPFRTKPKGGQQSRKFVSRRLSSFKWVPYTYGCRVLTFVSVQGNCSRLPSVNISIFRCLGSGWAR